MSTATDHDYLAREYRRAVNAQAETEDYHGHEVGDVVTIGRGTKVWTITGFSRYGDELHAHLELADGYTHSTANVTRLRAATP